MNPQNTHPRYLFSRISRHPDAYPCDIISTWTTYATSQGYFQGQHIVRTCSFFHADWFQQFTFATLAQLADLAFSLFQRKTVVFYIYSAHILAWCSSFWHKFQSTFYLGNSMSAGVAMPIDTWMHPKLDAILCELCIYYGSATVPKWAQKQAQRV